MASKDPLSELNDVLDDLDMLLKNPDVCEALTKKGLNISLALVASEGLRAYLAGDKARAHEEFETAAEEIRTRLEASREISKGKPS